MLEQQQNHLVSGLQEMYYRLQKASAWEGATLEETNGHPLVHDMLAALNLLERKQNGSGEPEIFEEDLQKLRSRMLADGADYVNRRGSFSSSTNRIPQDQTPPGSYHNTPTRLTPPLNKDRVCNVSSATLSSLGQISVSQTEQPHYQLSWPPAKHSPPQVLTYSDDPCLYAPQWPQALAELSNPLYLIRSEFDMQAPKLDVNMDFELQGDQSPAHFDGILDQSTTYPRQGSANHFAPGLEGMSGLSYMDGINMDFSTFMQPQKTMS